MLCQTVQGNAASGSFKAVLCGEILFHNLEIVHIYSGLVRVMNIDSQPGV